MVASKRAAPGVDQKGSDVDTNSIIPSSFHSTWVVSHEAKDIFNVETVPLKARLFSLSEVGQLYRCGVSPAAHNSSLSNLSETLERFRIRGSITCSEGTEAEAIYKLHNTGMPA